MTGDSSQRSRSRSRERSVEARRERSRERDRRSRYSRRSRSRESEEYRERSRDRYESRRHDREDRKPSERRSAFEDKSSEPRSDRWQPRPHDDEEEYENEAGYQDRRKRRYARQLESGLNSDSEDSWSRSPSRSRDSEDDYESSGYRSRHRFSRQEPSTTLFVRGIPDSKDESDLHQLFGSWPGIANIRVSRDRLTGRPRGFAFVEFDSPEAAEKVMDKERGYVDLKEGGELTLEFSYSHQSGPAQPSQALDWICNRCQAVNFAREEALHYLISPLAPVKEIRIILDRQIGVPKGFAFAQFHSVADASKVLHHLQDSELQGRPLRFAFARDRPGTKTPATGAAANALEAAQQMSAYSAWAPKEFDESALQSTGPTEAGQQTGAVASSRPGDTRNGGANGQGSEAEGNNSEFQYDSTTGYYYHAAYGYYYDANSGLYYDSADQKWKRHDTESGQYVAVEAQQPQNAETAAQAAIGATTAAVESMGHLQAQEVEYKPPAQARKRGAIIGSAAKLNPQGVLAAAKEAKAREEEQKRAAAIAAQKAQRSAPKQITKGASQPSAISQPQQPSSVPPQAVQTGPIKGVIRSSKRWGANRGGS